MVATSRMCSNKILRQWLWHSLAKLCTKNYENPSIFVKVTAKKISGTFFLDTVYNDHDWTHFAFCCCCSNRSNRYTCLLHWLTVRCPHVRRGDIKVFTFITPSSDHGPRMFTSDVRIPEFWIHISSAHLSASTLMSASAITRFTVTSFAACDVAHCNLHDRFLVLFAMSFLDTQNFNSQMQ